MCCQQFATKDNESNIYTFISNKTINVDQTLPCNHNNIMKKCYVDIITAQYSK